jgi:hypothetical protein
MGKSKLTLKIGEEESSYEWEHEDMAVGDILSALRGMLMSHAYSDVSFVNVIKDLAEQYETED